MPANLLLRLQAEDQEMVDAIHLLAARERRNLSNTIIFLLKETLQNRNLLPMEKANGQKAETSVPAGH